MDYFCSAHGLQFSLSSVWALDHFFFPEKDHGLATVPSLFSMYSAGASLSAQVMTPVWHARSSSVMSGSFQVRDRGRGTLEAQVNCCSARPLGDGVLLELWASRRVDPRKLLFISFSLPLRGPITCADRLGSHLWCIWAQSGPTATESSLWSLQHVMPQIPEAWLIHTVVASGVWFITFLEYLLLSQHRKTTTLIYVKY